MIAQRMWPVRRVTWSCAALPIAFQAGSLALNSVDRQKQTRHVSPPAVLKNARTLLDFERDGQMYSPTILWLSNHEFVINRCVKSELWHLFKRDIRTGKETPLKALTGNLAGTNCSPGFLRFAPDGRRAICCNQDDMIICAVDGRDLGRHKVGRGGSSGNWNAFTFGPDSETWLEYVQSQFNGKVTRIAIHTHDGRPKRIVQLTKGFEMPMTGGGGYDASVMSGPRLTLVATNDVVVRGDFANSTGSMRVFTTANLIQADLSGPRATPRVTKIPLPTDRYFIECVVSPNGRKVAWLTHERKNSYQAAAALWVSDIYGKRWKKLVHVTGLPSNEHGAIYAIGWLPNSRQVSVLTHAGLYLTTL